MASAKLGTKAVGSIVKLNVIGAAKEFIVVHQGKPSSLYDESCDGTWLLMKDIFERTRWHSSDVNNLENSTIHSILNSTFLNAFESNIRDAIKQVKIPYRKNGGSSGSDQSGANGLLCKIFLLSGYEIGFTTSDNPYFPQDGAKLSYFESGTDTSANNKRIAKLNGSGDHLQHQLGVARQLRRRRRDQKSIQLNWHPPRAHSSARHGSRQLRQCHATPSRYTQDPRQWHSL